MKALPKEKHKEKETIPNTSASAATIQSIPTESIVSLTKPEQEKILLKELLGNFSDQTGACFE